MSRYKLNQQLSVKYTDRFDKQVLHQLQSKPKQQRSFTDIVCLVIFALLILTFIIFLIYFLVNGASNIKSLTQLNSIKASSKGFGATIAKFAGIIIGMIFLSILLSVIFIILCSKFPKAVVYFGIIFTFVCYLVIIITAFMMTQLVLGFIVLVVAILNAILLYCWRQQIKIGIALLKASGRFMIQKPSVFIIGIISLLLNIFFLVFYIIGYLSAYSKTLPQNNDSQSSRNNYEGMMIFFVFMGIYLGYFLYYLMVFVVSTAVSFWYYQQQAHILKGYKTVRKHIGSLALASLVITIITILRRAAQQQANQSQNLCLKCVWCILACIMKCIQGFVEVLNHNSIIVMSVTGQNYFNSAKSALGLIARNFPLFWIVDFIAGFIQFYSLVICILVPSIIGGGLIWKQQKIGDNAAIGGVIIFLLSWIVTSVILGILYQVLSSVFIMFCLDKKLKIKGFNNGKIPQQIRQLFEEVQNQQNFTIVHHSNMQKPSTQTNLKKDNNKIPSLDNDLNVSNTSSGLKKGRKRKLNRKQQQNNKKLEQRSDDISEKSGDDNINDLNDNIISMEQQKNNHVSNYPMKGGDLQQKQDKTSPYLKKPHPFYLQQSQFKK